MKKIVQFLKETKGEMKRVVWPTRQKAVMYTLVVLAFSIGLGYALGGLDILLQKGLEKVLFN